MIIWISKCGKPRLLPGWLSGDALTTMIQILRRFLAKRNVNSG